MNGLKKLQGQLEWRIEDYATKIAQLEVSIESERRWEEIIRLNIELVKFKALKELSVDLKNDCIILHREAVNAEKEMLKYLDGK